MMKWIESTGRQVPSTRAALFKTLQKLKIQEDVTRTRLIRVRGRKQHAYILTDKGAKALQRFLEGEDKTA